MTILKRLLLILCIFFGSWQYGYSQTFIERISVPGPLAFADNQFGLSWSDKPNADYYVQEYLPKGEDPDHFKQMLAIHLFKKDITVDDAVQLKIEELNKRKKTDPVCNYKLSKSPDGKEAIIDCLLGQSVNDKMTVVEFVVYRFKQVQLDNAKGILVYAYSKRSYGDDITGFLKSLGDIRIDCLNAMISAKVPVVKIKG